MTYKITVGEDDAGPWATLECSADDCIAHEAARPIRPYFDSDDLTDALENLAEQDGWSLADGAWCPEHQE